MKEKQTRFYAIFLLMLGIAFSNTTYGQHDPENIPITPNAIFDTIFDKDGNRYLLNDLDIGRVDANPETALTTSCSAGYFNLYFETGSLGSGTSTQQAANQAVFCQVFSDVSNFINSPLTTNGLNKKVNIWVRDVNNVYGGSVPGGLLGAATQFYTMPGGSSKSGIVEGEVYKTIISGNDGYTNVVSPLFTLGSGVTSMNGVYFHGLVTFNFTGSINWNTTMSVTPTVSQYDLYSVALHEITHALGFASLLNNNGLSKFGSNYNYFSRYDEFLEFNNVPLISQSSSTACANYQYQFNPLHSTLVFTLAGGTCTNNILFGGTTNQLTYCPSTFNAGSSVSHFQDACHTGSFAVNPGYVMNPFSINGQSRRFLQPEERNALCDLGYNVNPNFGSASVAQGTFAYGGSACPGIGIAGINDGFSPNGNYLYTTFGSTSTAVTLSIPTTSIIANDFNATGLTCVESILSGTASVSGTTITYTAPVGYFGPVLLRYVPTNSMANGNITYIFGFIMEPYCSPTDVCDLIQNGNFETVSSTYQCGDGYSGTSALLYNLKMNCWYPYINTVDLFTRGCTNSSNANSNAFNLGTNTFSSNPVFNSHNPSSNHKVIGMIAGDLPAVQHYNEVVQNFLGAPLVNGQQYKLDFWAYNYRGTIYYPVIGGGSAPHLINASGTPLHVSFCAGSSVTAPLPINSQAWPNPFLTDLTHQQIVPVNQWTHITTVFTYTGSTNANVLYLSTNKQMNDASGWTQKHYVLIDDVSLLPVSTAPTFSFSPAIFCNNTGTVTNLSSYASPPGGTFSGPGVSLTGSVYNFSPVGLAAGIHQIVYTYTTPTTPVCTLTAVQQVTVNPSFTVTPMSQIIYAGQTATMTAGGSSGNYTWTPGPLTGSVVTVTPSVTTVYTVNNVMSGTCSIVSPTVIVSTACSQSVAASFGTSSTSSVYFPSGTYSTAGTVYTMQGTITFSANTSFAGYTLRMAPGTKLVVDPAVILTLDNCKLFGCTELWQGIRLVCDDGRTAGSIDVKNGTTIEDMYAGIIKNGAAYTTSVPDAFQGFIKITDSKLNKNYVGVQLINIPDVTPSGTTYSLAVKNTTFTTVSSLTSPGNSLKAGTSSGYVYNYNQIMAGTTTTTSPYVNFPRSYAGINLSNLSAVNNVLVGDTALVANTFNTFTNLDFGIFVKNTQLRVHNNNFFYMKGSAKQIMQLAQPIGGPPNPVALGPEEIGVGIMVTHTVVNTYSLQVGTKTTQPFTAAMAYQKANYFKAVNKGIRATNCSVVIVRGNLFDGDTTDVPVTLPTYPNTYYYYKNQGGIWVSATGTREMINHNVMNNYSSGIYSSHTIVNNATASIKMQNNNIRSLAATGYCKQAIQIEQNGGANMLPTTLEVSANSMQKVYNGIKAYAVSGGLYIHDNNGMQLDGIKTLAYASTNFNHRGIELNACTGSVVAKNMNINSTATITASNFSYFTGAYMNISPGNTITCNSTTNVGRGFMFQGNCLSNNGWMGNSISSSYQGLAVYLNGRLGTQGTQSVTLAANTWSNVTQETYVTASPNVNTQSNMFVAANSGSLKTAPTLNFASIPLQVYQTGPAQGIDIQSTGTAFSCSGGGCGGCDMGMMEMESESSQLGMDGNTDNNDSLYSRMVTASSYEYAVYPDEASFLNKQLVYKLQNEGAVTKDSLNNDLESFYSTSQLTNVGKFNEVQEAIANNQLSLAYSANSSITPLNAVEEKTQFVNEMMLHLNEDAYYVFTSSEVGNLMSIANECDVKGWYVIHARNIIHAVSGSLFDYENACDQGSSNNRTAQTEVEPLEIAKDQSFKLFPNPNNGNMTLAYDMGPESDGTMSLYDVTERLVNSFPLSGKAGTVIINDDQLQNGIYFYRILVKGKIVNSNKIVIIK